MEKPKKLFNMRVESYNAEDRIIIIHAANLSFVSALQEYGDLVRRVGTAQWAYILEVAPYYDFYTVLEYAQQLEKGLDRMEREASNEPG